MRALAKCLLFFLLLASMPIRLYGQLGAQPGSELDDLFPVNQLQFTEVVPPAEDEGGSIMSLPDDDLAADTDATFESPQPPATQTESLTTPPLGAIDAMSAVPEETPVVNMEVGQPFDLPITDALAEESAEVFSTGNWFRGGHWYAQQEVVLLLRTDLPPVHIAIDQSVFPATDVFATPILHSSQADFTYEAGTRLTAGRILGRDVANRDHGIEFSFLGLFDYTGRASIGVTAPGVGAQLNTLLGSIEIDTPLTQPGGGQGFSSINPVEGFASATAQQILYQADFNSFEANYRIGGRPARDRLVMQPDGRWVRFGTPSGIRALFAGFRYIRQNELFEYTSQGGLDDLSGVAVDESGLYRVTTDNDLFGIQFGGEWAEKRTDWVFGLRTKLGGLINFADRQSQVNATEIDLDPISGAETLTNTARTESLDDETVAILLEAGAYVSYYLRPNTAIRAGYDVMYLNGLATATNNIGLAPTFPKFELTGDSLYHGLSLGFEMTW